MPRTPNRDYVLKSCAAAYVYATKPVPEEELPLQLCLAQYTEIFRHAVEPGPKVNEQALDTAIDAVFHLTSTDMLHLQAQCPVTWEGLTALRPAAGQLQDVNKSDHALGLEWQPSPFAPHPD